MRGVRVALFLASASLVLVGCRSPEPQKKRQVRRRPNYEKPLPMGSVALQKVTDPAKLPYFGAAFHRRSGLLQAVDYSQSYFSKPSSRRYYPYLDITHKRARKSLEAFIAALQGSESETEFHEKIVADFDVYRSVGYNGQGTVFFTGYCEPIYDGSLTATPEFRYPLYKLPTDLVKDEEGTPLGRRAPTGETVPYYTRAEIENGALLKGQELVYLRDKLEAFVVHVQGSARLKLPDGSVYRVGYAGKTDRPYVSIGKALVRDAKIRREQVSLSRIKDFFAQHPEELDTYLHKNESFVFFTKTDGGPYGSIGVPVTPLRSVATDKHVFPRGCLGFVKTNVPFMKPGGIVSFQRFRSFVLDQDTGGAIRSAGRADLFLGTGPEAEYLAGRTQAEGNLYYVFVKEDAQDGAAGDEVAQSGAAGM